MARSANPRSGKLLADVSDLLKRFQKPIHYKKLTDIIIKTGLWKDPWGKEPDQILYSLMHNEYKAMRKDGRFLFFPGGIFCTSFVDGLEHLEPTPVRNNTTPRDPYKRQGDMPGDAERRRIVAEAAAADKKCGGCTSISYEGPNVHRREIGSCQRGAQSGRWSVLPCAQGCELWRQRTEAQKSRDRLEARAAVSDAMYFMATGKHYKDRGRDK